MWVDGSEFRWSLGGVDAAIYCLQSTTILVFTKEHFPAETRAASAPADDIPVGTKHEAEYAVSTLLPTRQLMARGRESDCTASSSHLVLSTARTLSRFRREARPPRRDMYNQTR